MTIDHKSCVFPANADVGLRVWLEGLADPTEEFLCASMRNVARSTFENQSVELDAEIVGLACTVTGIEDPASAIRELVEKALARWARLCVIDRVTARLQPESDPVPSKRARSRGAVSRKGSKKK